MHVINGTNENELGPFCLWVLCDLLFGVNLIGRKQ